MFASVFRGADVGCTGVCIVAVVGLEITCQEPLDTAIGRTRVAVVAFCDICTCLTTRAYVDVDASLADLTIVVCAIDVVVADGECDRAISCVAAVIGTRFAIITGRCCAACACLVITCIHRASVTVITGRRCAACACLVITCIHRASVTVITGRCCAACACLVITCIHRASVTVITGRCCAACACLVITCIHRASVTVITGRRCAACACLVITCIHRASVTVITGRCCAACACLVITCIHRASVTVITGRRCAACACLVITCIHRARIAILACGRCDAACIHVASIVGAGVVVYTLRACIFTRGTASVRLTGAITRTCIAIIAGQRFVGGVHTRALRVATVVRAGVVIGAVFGATCAERVCTDIVYRA
jgi:hypothetical protein